MLHTPCSFKEMKTMKTFSTNTLLLQQNVRFENKKEKIKKGHEKHWGNGRTCFSQIEENRKREGETERETEKANPGQTTHLAFPAPGFFLRKMLSKVLERQGSLPSPTCMRTTSEVVKALRTFLSGLAIMMYILGVNMHPRATVTLRLTAKQVVMIL